jgi:glycosyltransferase involved in cell wall biosynthesis
VKKPKIAIVNVFFPHQTIGGATSVVQDNVNVLRRDYSDNYDLVAFTSDANHRHPPLSFQVYIFNGIRVYQVSTLQNPQMDWLPKDEIIGHKFLQFLELEKPELIHFHCIQRLSASLVEVALTKCTPYIVTVHDAWWISDYQFLTDDGGTVYLNGHPNVSEIFSPPKGITFEESLERRQYLKSLLNRSNKVLSVSSEFADIYKANGICNIATTTNGIAARSWLPRVNTHSQKLRVGFVGGMSIPKGFEILRAAILKGKFSGLEFLLVDHSKSEQYQSHDVWGGSQVTIVGKYPKDRLPELYAKFDILIAPSIWPESFGLVTREAHAAGVWVIASNVGAIGADVQEGVNGNRITPSIEAIIAILKKIEDNPDLVKRKFITPNLRTPEHQVREIVAHYNSILDV